MLQLSIIALYTLLLACWLSSRHLMVLDEFFAWNLLSDPSWHHALASWNQGADSGGILYYALLWPLVQLSHGSVLVARLFSSLCYVLAGVIWWRALSRFLDARSAALGVSLVWLSSGLLLVYIAQVRFYTPFLLFSASAVWVTARCAQEDVRPGLAAILIFAAHACLVLIHMLGILYSGLIVTATLLCVAPRRRSLLIAACGMLSWLTLLPCRTAIRNGSTNATSQGVPVLRDVLRFHLKSSASAPVLLIALIGLVWLLREFSPSVRFRQDRESGSFMGPALCLAFLASPFCLYLLSNIGRPLGAARYVLPYFLSLGTLCAYSFRGFLHARDGSLRNPLTAAAVALAVVLHISVLRTLPASPTLDIRNLQALAGGRPIVVADVQTFFELQYYRSNKDLQFHFLLAPQYREHLSGMMATVAARGYFPNSFNTIDVFEQTYPEFLFLASSLQGSVPWVTRDPTCHSRQVGSVAISSSQIPVFDVTGCHPVRSLNPHT